MRPVSSRVLSFGCATLLTVAACDPSNAYGPAEPSLAPAGTTASLSSYYPPSEASGGWRKTTDASQIAGMGIDAAKLAALGSYLMALPSESYNTGVSGYTNTDKGAIVIKNGWIVGEYYNQPSAATGVYYLASNGKTLSMLLAGRMARDFTQFGFNLQSKLYDTRWLAQGFPLTDSRKADITFDQVFRHESGIIPEIEHTIASSAVQTKAGWNFQPATVGKDADFPVTAPLYYPPGNASAYTKGSAYSSVAFNHFSILFRNVSGLEPSAYLRQQILNPIGVGRMAYKTSNGMGDYVWATAGNGLASARDFARIGYLMLHEGDWNGTSVFDPSWLRQFTTSAAYRNLRSNVDCRWGAKYPGDMYRTTGSGLNWILVVPSLDLMMTFNGRTPKSQATAVDSMSLKRLFAAVTERYVACDGTVINDTPPPTNAPPSPSFTMDCTLLDCAFTDGSTDGDGNVVSWSWDFGDGATSTERHPSHLYGAEGSYPVQLTVTDDDGAPATTSRSVTVPEQNALPTAAFGTSCTRLQCRFTDGSDDSDGDVVAWSWTFGDGETSTETSPEHTYAGDGTYTVELSVTDDAGATATLSRDVTVTSTNSAPTAGFTSSCNRLSCGFTDTSSDSDGDVVAWSWDFGDGATSTVRNPSRVYAGAGTYQVTLTVTDDGGTSQQHTVPVTVTAPPAITLTATSREDATTQYMMLRWSGATSSRIDVYRNGVKLANVTENDGKHTVTKKTTAAATYVLKVCESNTSVCSNEVTLVFN